MQDQQVKIVFILSNVGKAMAFEWITKFLKSKGFEVRYILLGEVSDTPLSNFLQQEGIESHWIQLRGKGDWLRVFGRITKLLRIIRPDVVHTHLLEASLLGLSAARFLGIKKRVHTRHHSTFHHRYFPRSVRLDKLNNWLSTDIVAISPNVKRVLIEMEGVAEAKISLIPHGFDLRSFQDPDPNKTDQLRKKYNISDKMTVIGCIARYFELKGIQYLIPAVKRLQNDFPDIHLMLFNSKGPYQPEIKALLKGWDERSYTEVEFEEDLFSIYSLFDIFTHLPIDRQIEAFGQTYVEAMASSKACVFTLSGIAPEFVVHDKNALVVPYEDSEAVYQALKRILDSHELKSSLEKNASASVQEFDLKPFFERLERLYLSS